MPVVCQSEQAEQRLPCLVIGMEPIICAEPAESSSSLMLLFLAEEDNTGSVLGREDVMFNDDAVVVVPLLLSKERDSGV